MSRIPDGDLADVPGHEPVALRRENQALREATGAGNRDHRRRLVFGLQDVDRPVVMRDRQPRAVRVERYRRHDTGLGKGHCDLE